MHPALRKGPLFSKKHPPFPLFTKHPHFIFCLRACQIANTTINGAYTLIVTYFIHKTYLVYF